MFQNKRVKWLILLALLLALPTAVFAALDSTTLSNGVAPDPDFTIDLVSKDTVGDEITYTYAVTAETPPNALSHLSLGIGSCLDTLVSPTDGPYSTPTTEIPECSDGTYDCVASSCTVVTGLDATLGIVGVKVEDCSPQLANGETHIYQYTVTNVQFDDQIEIGGKYGSNNVTSTITGPVCGEPTAISLSSGQVTSTSGMALFYAAAVVLLSMMTAIIYRQRAHARIEA